MLSPPQGSCIYPLPPVEQLGNTGQKHVIYAMTGVAQWVGRWPANQKVTSSIPTQGTCLGCGPGPWLGECERQPISVSLTHQCFFFSSSSLPSPLSKI